jgi:hypothetical protein
MKLTTIFDVYSRRHKKHTGKAHDVPPTFRNRILLLCRDLFGGTRSPTAENLLSEFWSQIQEALQYRHGTVALTLSSSRQSPAEDVIPFLLRCEGPEFLDFVEYIFRVDCASRAMPDENEAADEINRFFAIDNMGLELTKMVKETTREPVNEYPFRGREFDVTRVVSYPKVIRKEDELVHSSILKPALELLAAPRFASANSEFIAALEHYRKGEYGDALAKASSALESVLKVICTSKHWPLRATDTSADLIKTVIKYASLEAYFEQPFVIIATLRNRLSTSHGAGTTPREPSPATVRYSLNATASIILFLVDDIG